MGHCLTKFGPEAGRGPSSDSKKCRSSVRAVVPSAIVIGFTICPPCHHEHFLELWEEHTQPIPSSCGLAYTEDHTAPEEGLVEQREVRGRGPTPACWQAQRPDLGRVPIYPPLRRPSVPLGGRDGDHIREVLLGLQLLRAADPEG